MNYSTQLTPFALAACLSLPAMAQADKALPEVRVTGAAMPVTLSGSDVSQLLADQPGFNVAAGGGVSGLPSMNGFAADRLKVRVDGMEVSAACANHMNPPLSYLDPAQVGKIRMLAGLTPVSMGGDSIGGTIEVESVPAQFAAGAQLHTAGALSLAGRSVDHSVAKSVHAAVANQHLSVAYTGAQARANSYKDGDGNKVFDTLYKTTNQSVLLAAQLDAHRLTLRLGKQHIPYQGFPNQYMDMARNDGRFANLAYAGKLGTVQLDAKAYWQDTEHVMGPISAERPGGMIMNTAGRNRGYALKLTLPTENGTVRIGNEYHAFELNDTWPAMPGSMMMGPRDYLSINDGQRDRAVLFAELDQRFGAQWSGQFGLRGERVATDAGQVQSYSNTAMNAADTAAAAVFNGRQRRRTDNNIDVTALARFQPDSASSYEFGFARKNRTPNLYERYSWGRGTMAMTMTNWFGDANGYVGDMDLKPETANTLSATANWTGGPEKSWSVTLNPYFTYVQDYIDTDRLGGFTKPAFNGNLLRFANHDARLYGVNLSGSATLSDGPALGTIQFKGSASITRGERVDGGNLYRMMPLHGLIGIEQQSGAWRNSVETKLVSRKSKLDNRRLEQATAGYGLVNLRSEYQAGNHVSLSVGVSNVFDKQYADPLGGLSLAAIAGGRGGQLRPLHGYGRSFDAGVRISF